MEMQPAEEESLRAAEDAANKAYQAKLHETFPPKGPDESQEQYDQRKAALQAKAARRQASSRSPRRQT